MIAYQVIIRVHSFSGSLVEIDYEMRARRGRGAFCSSRRGKVLKVIGTPDKFRLDGNRQ
jgi:hypothetical protein